MLLDKMVLSGYSSESCLPCELGEIVTHSYTRPLNAPTEEKVTLNKHVYAIPLSNERGYILYTRGDSGKDNVLVTNTLESFLKIDGNHTLGELITSQRMKSELEQLHYYDLLSVGESNGKSNGKLTIADIPSKYMANYEQADFVPFTLIPLTVELDITNSCNFTCIHCSRSAKPTNRIYSGDELSKRELFSIIDECASVGVPELLLMGGEPLVHPEFFELVRHAKARGILHVRTSTNGWLIIDDDMARELSKYMDNIQISIHGASSSTHDTIVGKDGSWDRAKQAVRILKQNNLKVNVSFTIMRENVDEINRMPHLVKEWGADSLRFLRLIGQGRGHLLERWTEEEVTKIGDDIKEIHNNLACSLELEAGGFASLAPLRNDASFYGCAAGKTLLCILSNGNIKPCGSTGDDWTIGQIRDKGLLDIWHSPEFVRMRTPMNCDDCAYSAICWGPCKVTP
ncbi:MAG: putative mycofactocin radical SAM maturase MftC [Syntrophomonadaceae bacterium]|nr:putative mycofactocin radical SAM maturase MftC [Bacillota bacterium]MBT9138612.1 putative mycofactocin radical SAM maturase MftC [Bacillota bacterium]MBT9147418.1 putative mycofactocin radical SAM maturase MftC [Bacillota bacterium]